MNSDSPSNMLVVAKPPARLHAALYRPEFADPKRAPSLLHMTILSLGPPGGLGCGISDLQAALATLEADPFLFVLDRIDAEKDGHAQLVARRRPPGAKRLRSAVLSLLLARGLTAAYSGGNRPHVTLHYKWKGPSVQVPIEPIPWFVDEVQLIESLTGRTEHAHHGTFRITPRQGLLFPLTFCAAQRAA